MIFLGEFCKISFEDFFKEILLQATPGNKEENSLSLSLNVFSTQTKND
jgi:hypothetical protein